jgi:ABC-type uncharacterized transport system substrate-binding protein
MNRRAFISLISTGTAFCSLKAHAEEERRLRRVGVLMLYSDGDPLGQARLEGFKQSLENLGWTDGRNVNIQVRWCGADVERTHQFSKELLAWQPDVIVTCAYRKSNPEIFVMQSAKDRAAKNTPCPLHGAR